MKRWLTLLLAAAVAAVMAGCDTGETPPADRPDGSAQAEQPADGSEDDPAAGPAPDEGKGDYAVSDGPRYDAGDSTVQRCRQFVSAFNAAPMAFDDPSQLTDEVMVFTAAAALGPEFLPGADGVSSYIELSSLSRKLREYFGAGAELSDGYLQKDYAPYAINGDEQTLTQYYAGGVAGFYFSYALIATERGYDLYLLDLMDPLFYDGEENRQKLMNGEEVVYDDVAGIAGEMQMNVYSLAETEGGRFTLLGFRYENFKDIDHYQF